MGNAFVISRLSCIPRGGSLGELDLFIYLTVRGKKMNRVNSLAIVSAIMLCGQMPTARATSITTTPTVTRPTITTIPSVIITKPTTVTTDPPTSNQGFSEKIAGITPDAGFSYDMNGTLALPVQFTITGQGSCAIQISVSDTKGNNYCKNGDCSYEKSSGLNWTPPPFPQKATVNFRRPGFYWVRALAYKTNGIGCPGEPVTSVTIHAGKDWPCSAKGYVRENVPFNTDFFICRPPNAVVPPSDAFRCTGGTAFFDFGYLFGCVNPDYLKNYSGFIAPDHFPEYYDFLMQSNP